MHNPSVCGQEEGYQGALGCDGETHNDVRLKVEPCRCAITSSSFHNLWVLLSILHCIWQDPQELLRNFRYDDQMCGSSQAGK